ncbi:MAG: tetratricopeptide repeat protein [Deltaproteobacteria bacterium]|nr:tetratricopeptide repeat protein [Deltaproteobacteria bacterium]
MLRRPRVALAIALTCATFAPRAEAQETSASLFADGQKLMAEKKYAEACPKFEKALSLSPGVGTKFNLGDCYEKTGRPASALKLFREVEDTTKQVGQAERSAAAKQRADALEPRVPTVVVVAPWLASKPNATITVDGAPLKTDDATKPVRVDFGLHEAVARWNDKETRAHVIIDKESESKKLALDEPGLVVAPAAPPAPPPAAVEAPPPEPESSSGKTQRVVGLVTGGAGLVMLGVGGVVVLGAKSDYDDATKACGTSCPREQATTANDARSTANVGGIVFGVGAVALVTGVVLFFTAPSSKTSSASATLRVVPSAGPNGAGMSMGGTF